METLITFVKAVAKSQGITAAPYMLPFLQLISGKDAARLIIVWSRNHGKRFVLDSRNKRNGDKAMRRDCEHWLKYGGYSYCRYLSLVFYVRRDGEEIPNCSNCKHYKKRKAELRVVS